MARFLGLIMGAALLLLSAQGFAQVPVAPPAAPPTEAPAPEPAAPPPLAPPPDVVVLKDGSRFRGTIHELVPHRPVTLVLATGEARTFEAENIAYAGLASQEPTATAAAKVDDDQADEEPVTPRNPRVRFLAADTHTKFFYRLENDYKELCEAPCAREFPPGDYEFAARRNPDDKLTLQDVTVKGDMVLTTKVNSRRGLRSVGKLLVTLGGLSAVGGAGYLLLAHRPDDLTGYAIVLHGFAAISVGFSFALKEDGLKVSVQDP